VQIRVALQKIADRNAYIMLINQIGRGCQRLQAGFSGERTGPEKEKVKCESAMHSAVGLRHGFAVAGSLPRWNDEVEAHNGSCVL
jgi:hypothetical protein